MKKPNVCWRVGALVVWLAMSTSPDASAKIEVASLFQDGAVLQHGQPISIWGTAAPGERIAVAILNRSASTITDARGCWSTSLEALGPGVKGTIEISNGRENIHIRDVITGDVWLCAGQSNMQLPLRMAVDGAKEAARADWPEIRKFKVEINVAKAPMDQAEGKWVQCNPTTAGDFSAVAYYFAREIFRRTHAPVGLIVAAKGGAPVESWLSPELLASHPQAKALLDHWVATLSRAPVAPARQGGLQPIDPREVNMAAVGADGYGAPGVMYNGMIHPLIPYTLRGIIWYQGEANASPMFVQPSDYAMWFKAMIVDWRTQWKKELPFYFVQLPANNMKGRDLTGETWATLREAQASALTLPQTGMAVTIDLGEPENIHPTVKEPVGRRLALLAAAQTYGDRQIVDQGPVWREAAVHGDRGCITFATTGGSTLVTRSHGPVAGFELSEDGGPYRLVEAAIDGDQVCFAVEKKSHTFEIRYAWNQNPAAANLCDSTGLPASPFRCELTRAK